MQTGKLVRRGVVAAFGLLFVLWPVAPVVAGGAGGIYWPSEREERLATLDRQVVQLQRELFNARMSGDQEAVRRLAPVFEQATTERLDLLRVLGQVQ